MEKTSSRTTAAKGTKAKTQDAIAILSADHEKVKKLFKEYESIKDSADAEKKGELAAEICLELTIHAQAEEEIFYPAVEESIDDGDLMDEAEVEHASAKDLIAQIEESSPDDDLFDAKVKVLGEYIDHHVKEEEGEMFPKAKKAKLDLDALGVEIQERKDELMAEITGEADDDQTANSEATERTKRR